MAVSPRLIRRRIKSVGNTRKITKAMELVAASKMRRAIESTTSSRDYAQLAWDMLVHLPGAVTENSHPLLEIRPVKKMLLLFVTSHRGLCGGFNANILRRVVEQLRNPVNLASHRVPGTDIAPVKDIEIDVATVGRKGNEAMKRMKKNIVANFTIEGDIPTHKDARPIAAFCIRGSEQGTYDKVVVAYTDFVSALKQSPKFRQLLPISEIDIEKMIAETQVGRLMDEAPREKEKMIPVENGREYLFEPDVNQILSKMLPRLVEVQVYQALLESSASEHSSRMMAMRNATDAAGDIIDDLKLTFNQARQAAITQEIAEIAAGQL